jgi:spore coat polysaccharide biosynthesis predicted glycosyltransferase SpsG
MIATSKPSIILAADCGGLVGWGHYSRCHALAAELAAKGSDVTLALRGTRPLLRAEVPLVSLSPAGFDGLLRRSLAEADLVVLDLRQWGGIEPPAKERRAILACIRDLRWPAIAPDIWIDPNVSFSGASPGSSSTTILGGGDHVILRRQFDGAATRQCAASPARALVAFGGTDQAALTALTLRALASSGLPIEEIAVVAGESPFVPDPPPAGRRIRVVAGVDDMRGLFDRSDLGVLAAGTMLHEACATGLPSFVVSLDDDQAAEAGALARRGAVVDLGPAERQSAETIAGGLLPCLTPEFRQSLARAAQAAIDGKGRARVAQSLIAAIERERSGVSR